MRKRIARLALVPLSFVAVIAACSNPTPDDACKAAQEKFNTCAKAESEKWGDKQVATCKEDLGAAVKTEGKKDWPKTVKKCAGMSDCETAKMCMAILLVGAGKKK